jgi:hypothetical protein
LIEPDRELPLDWINLHDLADVPVEHVLVVVVIGLDLNATSRKTCALEADNRAAFSRSSFKFTLKTALCHVACSMHEVAVSERMRLGSQSKDRRGITGAADAALTASVLHGRTRQMKGKL